MKRFSSLLLAASAALVLLSACSEESPSEAYKRGLDAGYEAGYSKGYSIAMQDAEHAFDRAGIYQSGYDAGYSAGEAHAAEAGRSALPIEPAGDEAVLQLTADSAAVPESQPSARSSAESAASAEGGSEAGTAHSAGTVYLSKSNIIHSIPDCSGMKRYTAMTLDEALAVSGARKCRICW